MANVKAAMEYAATLDREAREKRLSESAYDSPGPAYKHVQYPPDPPKKWVGLTDAEFDAINPKLSLFQFHKAVEAKLKEKNS